MAKHKHRGGRRSLKSNLLVSHKERDLIKTEIGGLEYPPPFPSPCFAISAVQVHEECCEWMLNGHCEGVKVDPINKCK